MSEFKTLTDIDDLKHLRELYRKHLPDTAVGYNTLNNYVRWFESNPKFDHIHVNVFHNWKETGFFLILDYYHVLINSLYMCDDDLKCALKLLDWTREYKIYALPDMFQCTIEDILQKDLNVNFKSTKLKVFEKDINAFEGTDAATLRVPDYLESRPLSIEDAKLVDDEYESQQEGSLEFIKFIIKYNITLGLYRKENNELVAWCTRCMCGFLDIFIITKAVRGRGLLEVLMGLYVQKLKMLGEDARAMVHDDDTHTRTLFYKLGFTYMEDVYIIYTLKKFR